jgi:hypothetical protein
MLLYNNVAELRHFLGAIYPQEVDHADGNGLAKA